MNPPASREGLPVMTEQLKPIEMLDLICAEIYERWDKDQRSGKLLSALSGALPRYRADVTAVRQAVNSYPEMREALEWYANVGNYQPSTGAPMTPYVDGKPDPTKPLRDFGALARKALATDREVK